MAKSFDVAVVGAGPGGLAATLEALRGGLSVRVFDKKKTIGVPVKCGEFLPVKEEMARLCPNARDVLDLFDMPGEAVDNVTEVIRVYGPSGRAWEFDFKAFILNRASMEGMMAEEAESMGAEISLRTPAHLYMRRGEIRVGPTLESSVACKVVIAADGFPSTIASEAGLPTASYISDKNNVAVLYQYVMDGVKVEEGVTEIFFGTKACPGGYAWIIPKGGGVANVGSGVRTPYMDKGLDGRWYFTYFLKSDFRGREKLAGAKRLGYVSDVLPVGGPLARTHSGPVLAVGDAAGMVMPTNGGGIATALVTGRLAGRAAVEYLHDGVSLSSYEQAWKERIGKEMFDSTRVRRFSDRFMKNDGLFQLAMELLGVDGIKDIITCRVPKALQPILWLLGYR